jgi:predicted ATPase
LLLLAHRDGVAFTLAASTQRYRSAAFASACPLPQRCSVALFAEMLSLPNDGHYPAIVLTPEQRRQRTLEALTEHLAGLASQNPVLMIFEDAHWTDPTSLEAFGRTVDRIRTLPVLLIVTGVPTDC